MEGVNELVQPTEKEILDAYDVLLRACASQEKDIIELEVSKEHFARFEILEKDSEDGKSE